MKNIFILLFLTHSFFLQATSSSQDNTNPPHKHSINFYGTLVTHQGNTFKVENISIENRYKQIPMYDRPDEKNLPPITENKETGKKEIILTDDPHEYTTTAIDLDEIAEIRTIPEPLFVFKKQEKSNPVYFVQVDVISSGNKTIHHYLMSDHAHFECDEINPAGNGPLVKPSEPIKAIKSLTIEGFSQRMENKKQESATAQQTTARSPKKTAETK